MRRCSLFNGLRCGVREEHAIDVVNISVFPASVMDRILLHRDFRPIEDGRLLKKRKGGQSGSTRNGVKEGRYFVHVIPDVHGTGALGPTPLIVLPSVELVQLLVPFPAVRVEEIDPCTISTPTPPLELLSMFVFGEQIKLLTFLVNGVVEGAFDMWVNDDDHLYKVNFNKAGIQLSSVPFEPELRRR